jgi:putative endonuclease
MSEIYYIYVLINKISKRLYVGFTSDLKNRLRQHKQAKLSHRNKNFELIYFDAFINKKDAMQREKYLKTTNGKRMLKLMLKETFKLA